MGGLGLSKKKMTTKRARNDFTEMGVSRKRAQSRHYLSLLSSRPVVFTTSICCEMLVAFCEMLAWYEGSKVGLVIRPNSWNRTANLSHVLLMCLFQRWAPLIVH